MKALSLSFAWILVSLAPMVRAQTGVDHRGARLFKSGPIQITADGRWVWCVNPDNDSVARLDTLVDSVREIVLPAGQKHDPKGLSVREDGSEVWVACHDSDRVYVLDTEGMEVARIDLPWGSGPFSVALSPDQKLALVTLHRAEAVAVLDVAEKRVSKILDHIFWAPMGIAWTEGGKSAWINHIFAPGEHPFETRVDFSGPEPVVGTSIRITPADPRQSSKVSAPYNLAEGGYLNIRGHSAQPPGRNELWMPTQYHNIGQDIFTSDSTIQSVIRRINLSTRKLLELNTEKVILTARYVHLPESSGAYQGPGWDAHVSGPIDLAFSADGKMAYLLHELSRDLVVLPVNTPAVKPANAAPLPEITVGDRPIGLALSPTTGKAYVCNQLSRDISVVDLELLKEAKRVPTTPITGETFPEAVLRGAKIFHSSDDPRISKNSKVGCASCHINGEHDGRTWPFERLPGRHGPRSTPSMLGLRLGMGPRDPTYGWGQLHRSGDRDEIQDFELTFQNPQMGGTGFLGAAAQPELGAPNAGLSPDLDALASYLLFLDPLKRSPYRGPQGELTEAARRGATFFRGLNRAQKRGDAGCVKCHVPETGFLDFKFHDVGEQRSANEQELNNRTPAWNVGTLTLVGVWATPPYSGVAQGGLGSTTRESMLSFLKDSAQRASAINNHGTPDGLTARQLSDLAEFVLSIDGNMTAAEVNQARDTEPPRITRAEVASLFQIDVWFNETIDQASAEDKSNWLLRDQYDRTIPIASITRDSESGDRLTLKTTLEPFTQYSLAPVGPITDDAGAASGGVPNPIDRNAPENTRQFTITDQFTVALGRSSLANIDIPVYDASMAGPSLSTWGRDSIWLLGTGSSPASTTGFIRFNWRNLFSLATGVTNAADILQAAIELRTDFGNAQRIEFRRMLQRWNNPTSPGDFNSNPVGAPTWRDSSHPSKRWNSTGAGRLGSLGTQVSDYFGVNDLAARADATLTMTSITDSILVTSDLVTDAFRFWFDNPGVDYGYAVRLTSSNAQDLRFVPAESRSAEETPLLHLTYRIAGARPRLQAGMIEGALRVTWPMAAADWKLQSATSIPGAWSDDPAPVSVGATELSVQVPISGADRFFRLVPSGTP